jgi:hypothetical protein
MILTEYLTSLGHPLHVVVTGGRGFTNEVRIRWALEGLHAKYIIAHLAHGDARGADTIAGRVARSMGIEVQPYPVDNGVDGPWPAAGHRRNDRMLTNELFNKGGVDLVVAFPGGRGTAGCVKRADELHIRVWEVKPT